MKSSIFTSLRITDITFWPSKHLELGSRMMGKATRTDSGCLVDCDLPSFAAETIDTEECFGGHVMECTHLCQTVSRSSRVYFWMMKNYWRRAPLWNCSNLSWQRRKGTGWELYKWPEELLGIMKKSNLIGACVEACYWMIIWILGGVSQHYSGQDLWVWTGCVDMTDFWLRL